MTTPPLRLTSVITLSCVGALISCALGCNDDAQPALEPPPTIMSDAMVTSADLGVTDQGATPDQDVADMSTSIDLAPPIAEVPQMPVTIAVKLGSEVTEAGVVNRVTCQLYDQAGERVLDPELLERVKVDVRPQEGWRVDEADPSLITGLVANPYDVRCTLASWSLRSQPTPWLVTPAAPARLTAVADLERVVAGEESHLECVAYDSYDNRVTLHPDEVTWSVSPMSEQVTLSPRELTTEGAPLEGAHVTFSALLAAPFDLACSHPSATTINPAHLEVVPDLPSRLITNLKGSRDVFRLDEVVEVEATVVDQYGNEVESAPLSTSLSPNTLDSFGPLRYLASEPGAFELLVRVLPPTREGWPLSDTLSFRVDDGAPQISCVNPSMGAMRDLSPFSLQGHIEESGRLQEVTIDGTRVFPNASGDISKQVTPTWGLNLHEITARDDLGQVSSAMCAYIASGTYLSESARLNSVAQLTLTQNAIDDGSPRTPISSLGDLLGGVLNSSSLISTINSAVRAQNPIVPVECRIPGLFGSCIASAGASFDSLSVGGPNTVALTLRSNRLGLTASINQVRINLTASGRAGFNWSQSGYATVSSVGLSGELNVGMSGGNPSLTVAGTPSVSVGTMNLYLNINVPLLEPALNGFINLLFNLFEGTVRDLVATQLRTFVTTQVDSILTGALSNLDLSDIGMSLSLPNLFGGAPIMLNLSFSLGGIEVSSRRLLMNLNAQLSGSRAHSRSSAGVPSPSSSLSTELYPGSGQDIGGSAHLALINSTLHRLWRAGMFDVQSVGSALPNLPAGFTLSFITLTPPAMELYGPGVNARLHFGPARAQVRYPGLIDEPITLYLGGWASSSVSLASDGTLSFGDLELDELRIGTEGLPLSPSARAALELTLTDLLQSLFDTALNEALPSFPIPDFAIPNTFTSFGVPRNLRLGARSLTLEQTSRHLIVKGDFRQ